MSWTPEQRARYAAKAAENRRRRMAEDPEYRARAYAADARRRKERMASDPEYRARAYAADARRRKERMASDPEYAARLRERGRAQMAKFRAANRERAREINRRSIGKLRAERPLECMLYQRAQYERHREKRLAYMKRRYAENPAAHKEAMKRAREADRARCRADADFYAVKRAQARMWYAATRVRQGKPYSPRPQCRIPDAERMGRGPDAASAFLPENVTPSRRAFARELAVERRKAKAGGE